MAAGGMGQVNGVGDTVKDNDDTGQFHHMVSDDMLYKLSKKIAQLTKVLFCRSDMLLYGFISHMKR